MSEKKYRVVQNSVNDYEIQEWKYQFSGDMREPGEFYWVKIDSCRELDKAKKIIDTLVDKNQFPKVVYEK